MKKSRKQAKRQESSIGRNKAFDGEYFECPEETLRESVEYLNGKVFDDDFEAACRYEYARESSVLREAARVHKRAQTGDSSAADALDDYSYSARWINDSQWVLIWDCAFFPKTGWNHLGKKQRAKVACPRPDRKGHEKPFPLSNSARLDALGVFDLFKDKAAKARVDYQRNELPIVRDRYGKLVHLLLTFDPTRSENYLRGQFANLLRQPEVAKLLRTRNMFGTTGEYNDRLKDLASWRLHRTLGPRKADELIKSRLSWAPRRLTPARTRALDYRAMLFPFEFGCQRPSEGCLSKALP